MRKKTEILRTLLLSAALTVPGLVVGHAYAADAESATAAQPAAETAMSPEEALRARAIEYWDLRKTRSGKVYSFYLPADKGGPKTTGEVSEGGPVRPETYQIERIEVNGDQAVVFVSAVMNTKTVGVSLPKSVRTRNFDEKWFRSEGTWYKEPIPREGFSKKDRVTKRADGSLRVESREKSERSEKATE